MNKFSIAVLLFAGFAGNAPARQRAPSESWANLIQLVPGTEIRVALSGGRTVRGTVQKVTSDSLAINATASQETLARTEIKRVELKSKGRRGRNALIGLLIGTGGGLAVGAAIDHSQQSSFNFFPNFGKAVFTPLGAVTGAAIGVLIPSGGWHEIYRAP